MCIPINLKFPLPLLKKEAFSLVVNINYVNREIFMLNRNADEKSILYRRIAIPESILHNETD